jgi:hypothetical protein
MEFSFSKKMAFLYLPWYEPDIVATQWKRVDQDWRHGSSSRVPTLQVQNPEFKPQSHQKKRKKKKKKADGKRVGQSTVYYKSSCEAFLGGWGGSRTQTQGLTNAKHPLYHWFTSSARGLPCLTLVTE